MQISYTSTRSDLAALLRYNLRHSPRFWLMLVSLALFPAAVSALTTVLVTGKNANGFAIPVRAFSSADQRDEFLGSMAEFRAAATRVP